MDTSPIPGFITRRQASEKCKRAERTLQRYWSRAIEQSNTDVLEHLKLRTEDGEIIEGPDVTKDLIDQLKKSAKNPTWYVHATWVEKTYGPRLDAAGEQENSGSDKEASEAQAEPPPSGDAEVVSLLREQIGNLQQDKQDLREELKIKNQQINQANERDRETHHLMRDLHKLLADMQQRLPAPSSQPLPVSTDKSVHQPAEIDATPAASAIPTETPTTVNTEKGSGSAPKKRRSPGTSKKRKASSTKKPKKKTTKKQRSSLFQKHTPTLHKAASRFFRR